MASRRDQLHSYQFLIQRVISAFVMRETDPAQSPLRRGVGAVFAGVMFAVLGAAGFGVVGLVTKVGSGDWRSDGSVVIEKETGASFVYLAGRLHPALNYASALLASGKPQPAVVRVSGKALAGIPRAVTVGIPGAPNSLPPPTAALGMPWTVCSGAGAQGPTSPRRAVGLLVGSGPTGAIAVADGQGLLLVDSGNRQTYLVWRGARYAVTDPQTVAPALFGAVAATPVGTAWLNALPAGPDIRPLGVPHAGAGSPAIPGRNIGDMLVATTGAGPQYYLVFGDGVAPITVLQKDLQVGTRRIEPIEVTLPELTAAPQSKAPTQPAGDVQLPPSPPTLLRPRADDLLCTRYGEGAAAPQVTVGGRAVGLDSASSPAGRAGAADAVVVPPGRVAVLRAMASPDAAAGPYHIVTDMGIRYAVPSETVLGMLGYASARLVNVPAGLVKLIPVGPALDPAAAVRPAEMVGTGADASSSTSNGGKANGDDTNAASATGDVLALVNQERSKAGCAPVSLDARLGAAAAAHSQDMVDRNYYDHITPDGVDPGHRMSAAGYKWSAQGENIAFGYNDAAAVMVGWMDSAQHRGNILNCNFRDMGVGLAYNAQHVAYWTQDFGTPA
jgi:type VII secretion protein EccB